MLQVQHSVVQCIIACDGTIVILKSALKHQGLMHVLHGQWDNQLALSPWSSTETVNV